jgi:hypothetical protein
MKFTNYTFNLLFLDPQDPDFGLVMPVTVRATGYEPAVHKALFKGQEVLRDYNGERVLFMRLQKCPTL